VLLFTCMFCCCITLGSSLLSTVLAGLVQVSYIDLIQTHDIEFGDLDQVSRASDSAHYFALRKHCRLCAATKGICRW